MVTKPPTRFQPTDPHSVAEAAFKKVSAAPTEAAPAVKKVFPPGAKELVSLRIDQEVLQHFQEAGVGWQERINEALRKAAGLNEKG